MVVCEKCGKHFANKSNLNRHASSIHGEDESDNDKTSDNETENEEYSDDEVVNDDNENCIPSVWLDMKHQAAELNMSILELYKDKIMFYNQLKRTPIHRAVMKTLQRVQSEDDMSYYEALEYAIDKRKFLILQTTTTNSFCRTIDESSDMKLY